MEKLQMRKNLICQLKNWKNKIKIRKHNKFRKYNKIYKVPNEGENYDRFTHSFK